MIIVTQNSFPPESAKDIGKAFLKLGKLPEYMSIRGPFVHSGCDNGICSITLYECDKSKLSEGVDAAHHRQLAFSEVKGFKYSVNVWLEAPEALKMLGLG
jgi:hypothetical protein